MKIYHFDEIDSTNEFANRIRGEGQDAIITARVQTRGRGSKGRSFVSDRGGLYLTKLSFYEDFPSGEVFRIMVNASVAVCKTVEAFGLSPRIKWPNDVYVDGKKICGILISNTFSGSKITCSVVGIGINVENELTDELKGIAVSMKEAGAVGYTLESVRDALVEHLQRDYSLEEYRKYISFFGKEIVLIEGEGKEKKKVVALGIDGKGRLQIRDGDTLRLVSAGEVSLRFQEGGIKHETRIS